jgi:integrase
MAPDNDVSLAQAAEQITWQSAEAIRLQWRDARIEERTLSVKTHRRKEQEGRTKPNNRDIPMSGRLVGALSATPARDQHGYLFTKPDGTSWLDYQPNRASKALNKILKESCARMRIEPLRIHDLRHTFAYQATVHGADLGDLQHLLGHSDISQTMRYRGWIASRARTVIEKF